MTTGKSMTASLLTGPQKELGKLIFSALAASIMLGVAIVGSTSADSADESDAPTSSYAATYR